MALLDFFHRWIHGTPFGLAVSDTAVTVLQLQKDGDHPRVGVAGFRKLSEGVVRNGEILQEKALADFILAALREASPRRLPPGECFLVFPEAQSYEHIFSLPPTPKEKLAPIIEKEISETFPVAFSEMTYDFTTYHVGQIEVVSIVAVKTQFLHQYLKFLQQRCHLAPVVVEPEAASLLRNMRLPFEPGRGLFLVILKGKSVKWYSFWSGLLFDSNIVTAAETQELALRLLDDLTRSMNFFETTTKQKMGKMVFLGLPEEREAFAVHLRKLDIPVISLVEYRVDPRELPVSHSAEFQAVAGAALRAFTEETGEINLVKEKKYLL